MTVLSPSLPPYRVTSTSVRASGSRSPAVRRRSVTAYAPPPTARAVTPLATRNRRRVMASMTRTSSVDGVFGGGEADCHQPFRLLGGRGAHGRGGIGPGVDGEQPGQRVEPVGGRRLGELLGRGRGEG